MIKIMLKLIAQDIYSIDEIARKLHISKNELINRFEILDKMGYIKKIKNTEIRHKQNKMCQFCQDTKNCSKSIINTYNGKMYKITKKGEKISRIL